MLRSDHQAPLSRDHQGARTSSTTGVRGSTEPRGCSQPMESVSRRDTVRTMFHKVIIGIDGRSSDDVTALARVLAPGAELMLANVYHYDMTPSRASSTVYRDALRDDARALLRGVREDENLPQARLEALAGTSPAKELHRLAEREGANLLIVGSAHHGPIGRTLLGDVARAALHGSPCPVAVAPGGFAGGTPAIIGVAFDGSAESRAALDLAAGVAAQSGARVRVVGAATMGPLVDGEGIDIDDLADDLHATHQRVLEEAVAGLPVDARAEAQVGRTATVLGRLAAEVDLLVCGSRGRGALTRVVVGSIADRLIHDAPCAVIVVPHSALVSMSAHV